MPRSIHEKRVFGLNKKAKGIQPDRVTTHPIYGTACTDLRIGSAAERFV